METIGVVASWALLALFCAGVVVAYVRKERPLAVLSLVAAVMFGVLALGRNDPEVLRAAAEFVANFTR